MKTIPVILAVALLGVGYWSFSMRGQLQALRADAAKATKEKDLRDALTRENRSLRDRVAELEGKSMLSTLPAAAESSEGDRNSRDNSRKATQDALQSIASKMLNTPAMRTMITQRARAALEAQYSAFFDQMQLGPEQRSRLLDLMVERQAGSIDIASKLMMGNLSQEERAEVAQQMRAETQAANSRIHEYLGEQGYSALQSFTRDQAERTQMVELAAAFNQTGEPLSNDQSTTLRSIISEERRGFRFSQDPGDSNADPSGVMTGQATEAYLRESEQLQTQITSRAAGILSPTQLETFRKAQASQLQRSRNGIDMARQMLGQ